MRRWSGLIPVQRVCVVSRGPSESLNQHAYQDKTGTSGLEICLFLGGEGLVTNLLLLLFLHLFAPPPSHHLLPPLSLSWTTASLPRTYLSISRGFQTSPALLNSTGNVGPNRGGEFQQQNFFILFEKYPKNLSDRRVLWHLTALCF